MRVALRNLHPRSLTTLFKRDVGSAAVALDQLRHKAAKNTLFTSAGEDRSFQRALPQLGLAETMITSSRGFKTSAAVFIDTPIEIPSMGDAITEGSIAEILKAAGDTVDVDEIIAQVETDKVTIDIRSPLYGTISSISVGVGDTVVVGQQIAAIAAMEGAPPPKAPAAPATPAATAAPEAASTPPPPPPPAAAPAAGPAHGRTPSIQFPPRRTPEGELISAMPAEQAKAVTLALMGVQAAAPTVGPLVGFTSAGDHPPRALMSEEEMLAVELGGAM